MKRFTAVMLLVLTAGLMVGCAASAKDSPVTTKAPINRDDIKVIIPKDNLSSDHKINLPADILCWEAFHMGGDVEQGFYTRVFTDYDAFSKEFPSGGRQLGQSYSAESFENSFVVAVYLVANSGGWNYELESANVSEGRLSVNIKGIGPKENATMALERHVMLITVDRADYSENFSLSVTLNGKTINSGKVDY